MLALALSGIVLTLAALLVVYPLLFQQVVRLDPDRPDESQFNERNALLEAMSELETEYQGGKLSEPDYLRHKARYQRDYLALAENGDSGSAGESTPGPAGARASEAAGASEPA